MIVLDAFSDGGAGVWNNSSSRGFELADNLDFNVGRKHQMRVGILLEGDAFSNFDAQNNAGHVHLQQPRWRSTPAGPRRSRSATAR